MEANAANDDFLAGKFEGLIQAAHLMQRSIARGVPLERILFEVLELADQVNVVRTMDFDDQACEYVDRAP